MANHKSTLKRIRQNEKRRLHNRYYGKTMRNAVRKLRATTEKEVAAAMLPAVTKLLDKMAKKGIILVNSAGNSGMGPWKKITFPADAYDILTVGALNTEKKNAPFSGVGPTQDGRVKPDVMALGSPTALISGRGTIVRDMGTSFSTPVVAGLVACLWQALPELTALEIIQLIRESGSNYQKPDNVYGYGTPNFWRAYMIGKKRISESVKREE